MYRYGMYYPCFCAANVTENIIILLRQCQECLTGIKQPTLFLPPVSLHSLRCSFLLLELLLPQLLLLNEPFLCRIYELHDLRTATFALEPFSLNPEQSILSRKLIPADTSDSSSLSDTSYLLSFPSWSTRGLLHFNAPSIMLSPTKEAPNIDYSIPTLYVPHLVHTLPIHTVSVTQI